MADANTAPEDASGWTQVVRRRARRSGRPHAPPGDASSSEPSATSRHPQNHARRGHARGGAPPRPLCTSRQLAPPGPVLGATPLRPPPPPPPPVSAASDSAEDSVAEHAPAWRPPPPRGLVRQPRHVRDTWDPQGEDRLDPEASDFRDTGGRSLMDELVDDGDRPSSSKRSRENFETGNLDSADVLSALRARGASTVLLYRNAVPDPEANDIWPEYRSRAKLPAVYSSINPHLRLSRASKSKRRQPMVAGKKADKSRESDRISKKPIDTAGRPTWKLPVELVELVASYLDRDDIKALRMVSRELNYFISQVIFRTVVVPFNTEIYGMLVQGREPDTKGKTIAKSNGPGFFWKNTNGDEVYNGHGLDVFKGFGQHILQYGMSFEVTEESLAQPPVKCLTESKKSFWGTYDWPYEEYRRFDAVAGLETAADETPRMTLAFSELSRVKELALSIDSGLGWLNGPDRSIRARILQQPTAVFGTKKQLPDRRAQAQQQLWHHIEARHQANDEDVKLAALYRLSPARSFPELEHVRMLAEEQPPMPYIDSQLVHEAVPHEARDTSIPNSFDNPEVLDDFLLPPVSSDSGILFTSVFPPNDAAQIRSPVVPASLTKAQMEWLLETEWAQHAFLSSYMLSIIDNPTTFSSIHTLNIARLSDRYLTTLDRVDFWDALPSLKNLTLMVVPGWRTVRKDAAGYVHTPSVNPAACVTPFCDLLINRVTQHPGIQNLTFGWADGGEHAEGLHARNKLLLPAPLIPLGMRAHGSAVFSADMLQTWDPERLRVALLKFPHVEQLTLKNCWLTPMAVLELVKAHDALKLKNLVFDSVSLTAVLKPSRDAQAAAAGAVPPPNIAQGGGLHFINPNPGAQGAAQAQPNPQPLPNNTQLLNWLSQSLQTLWQHVNQMQQTQGNAGGAAQQTALTDLATRVQQVTQLLHALLQAETTLRQQGQNQQQAQGQQNVPTQQHLLQHQQNINLIAQDVTALDNEVTLMQQQIAAAAPTPQTTASTTPTTQTVLHAPPRNGSWTSIIDKISPGTNLADFGSTHSKSDPERHTVLQSIEFKSCGYAKLPGVNYDQTPIDHSSRVAATPACAPLLLKRYNALSSAMLPTNFPHLGEIVQSLDDGELAMLEAGWNFTTGWSKDMDPQKVEFDGKFPGGTGRFSGRVCKSDKVSRES
ncbi:hypothetical protein BDU57DRAFT_519929 [Ampelomyces quisqualis]|uniref:F-box domain-containing protein n=1 Tax=Ampelomyces quisqualis TaxID=50730 RepID=A0A6A5QIU9_AMPQU|nr:hypothetical protein BDU57DRAFT_519929 [Ampelomyces quisqualis]